MHYGTTSKLKPEMIMQKAEAFFIGFGLQVKNRSDTMLCMAGGGGTVTVYICAGETTDVDIITSQWDDPVKQFLQRIG